MVNGHAATMRAAERGEGNASHHWHLPISTAGMQQGKHTIIALAKGGNGLTGELSTEFTIR